jgi:hypothetical protein
MKVLFVYTGSEQGSWGSIAFSRSQHYYIMPGILNCEAALRDSPLIDPSIVVSCRYFNTTVQTGEEILREIVVEKPDIVGFSCYCWNMPFHRQCMAAVRTQLPGCTIICGGPEVRCSTPAEAVAFFAASPECDALLFGEAELRIAPLITALADSDEPSLMNMRGIALNPMRYADYADFSVITPVPVDALPSPYPFTMNIKLSSAGGRAMVFETMRGCPQKCIYCQFSRRDHTVRKFPLERVYRELKWLLESGIECLHVADSVFDIDAKRAGELLDFYRENNRVTSLFCYCAFVTIDETLTAKFEATRAQIGVGVQSTNVATLKSIERTILPSRLLEKKALLQQSRLNFYIDLMFGLPGDSPAIFDKSFNDTVVLNPSFMMLFPLSLIKGTPLGDAPERYGVRPVSCERLNLLCDIRYDNIALASGFAEADLERFDDEAIACFYFYNRFALSARYLISRSPDAAATMASIGKKTKTYLRKIGRVATNTDWLDGFQDIIHGIFMEEATGLGAGPVECDALDTLFKLDIYRILALNAPQREKIFRKFEAVRNNPLRREVIAFDRISAVYLVGAGKIIRTAYRWADLRRLAELRETITPAPDSVYLHAPFEDWDARIVPLSPVERSIVEMLPAEKPLRWSQLLRSVMRVAKRSAVADNPEDAVKNAIVRLADEGIVYCPVDNAADLSDTISHVGEEEVTGKWLPN